MDASENRMIPVQVALPPALVETLQRIAHECGAGSLEALIGRWLGEKALDWQMHAGSQPQAETVEDLVNEKDRLLEWLSGYVAAVQRSEREMRQALEHIERIRTLIPKPPSDC